LFGPVICRAIGEMKKPKIERDGYMLCWNESNRIVETFVQAVEQAKEISGKEGVAVSIYRHALVTVVGR